MNEGQFELSFSSCIGSWLHESKQEVCLNLHFPSVFGKSSKCLGLAVLQGTSELNWHKEVISPLTGIYWWVWALTHSKRARHKLSISCSGIEPHIVAKYTVIRRRMYSLHCCKQASKQNYPLSKGSFM